MNDADEKAAETSQEFGINSKLNDVKELRKLVLKVAAHIRECLRANKERFSS